MLVGFLVFGFFLLILYPCDSQPARSTKSNKPLEDVNFFLGDIVLKKQLHSLQLRNGLKSNDRLWTMATIPVEVDIIFDDLASSLIAAFDEFHQKTCIRFVKRDGESDYVRFIYDEGCYSSVGRVGGVQTISLGPGCDCKGTILHELMHTLGFWHEQNRSDRDEFVEIITENVANGALNMFEKLSSQEERLFTTYDYVLFHYHTDSITHYDSLAFSLGNNLKTMVPKKRGVILRHPCEKGQLSKLDVDKLKQMYQCDRR